MGGEGVGPCTAECLTGVVVGRVGGLRGPSLSNDDDACLLAW